MKWLRLSLSSQPAQPAAPFADPPRDQAGLLRELAAGQAAVVELVRAVAAHQDEVCERISALERSDAEIREAVNAIAQHVDGLCRAVEAIAGGTSQELEAVKTAMDRLYQEARLLRNRCERIDGRLERAEIAMLAVNAHYPETQAQIPDGPLAEARRALDVGLPRALPGESDGGTR
jgi:hypothetical protein